MFNPKNNNMKQYLFLIGLTFAMFSFSSCDKDDPTPPNEEELITTLTLTMTPQNGGDALAFQFQDLDGDGGNDPIITSPKLAANTTYDATIVVLNESVSPTENLTNEVRSEGEDHQFFFATTTGVNLSFSYDDMDSNGKPIGLSALFQTGEASSGGFQVTLRHEPNKSASGVLEGDISNAGGDTDIEVVFDLEIE